MQPEQVVTNNQGQRFSTDNAELVELRSNQNENRTQGASQVLLPKIEQQETTQSVIQFTQAPQQANQQEPELEGLNTQNNNIHEGAVTDDRLNIDNEVHTRMSQQELINLINKRFNEVKRSSTIYKYYTKILFQILIYISTILELIFTLLYGKQNNISDEPVYEGLYYFSIALTVLLHVYVWIYTYKYMNVQRHHLCWDLLNYVYYAIIGGLSYIKLLPFLCFTLEISLFSSFHSVKSTNRQGNPSGLFKKRNKPINIFRDLIFHRIALISMMITFLTQSIPMLLYKDFTMLRLEEGTIIITLTIFFWQLISFTTLLNFNLLYLLLLIVKQQWIFKRDCTKLEFRKFKKQNNFLRLMNPILKMCNHFIF